MTSLQSWVAQRCIGPLRGRIRVPGDKSLSHRAVMFGAIAEGVTEVRGFLEGEDTRATAAMFEAMGVRIETPDMGVRIVHGVGMHGLRAPMQPLDCGNSGTGMRLMAGLLAGQRFASVLVGDASLQTRPMRRVADPLRLMSAEIETDDEGRPPLRIQPTQTLTGMYFESPVASAQVKSAVLLTGLYASGETEVREPHPTRDATERLLREFGVDIAFGPGWAKLRGGQCLRACDVEVPGDFSSAAFALVAACIVPGSDVVLQSVGVDERRTGLLRALQAMGADIELRDLRETACGAIADLHVRAAPLRGIDVPEAWVADMIDEFPALLAAAACAEGITRVRGAAELRVKESDRIAAMAIGLRALGVHVHEVPDGIDVHGGPVSGGEVQSHGDHRIAMSFAVLAQRAEGEVLVHDTANVATSYPGFAAQMRELGFALRD